MSTPRRPAIDLNADLGEGFPDDARLLDLVTSASVCCGAHAGDRDTTRATLDAARSRGVTVGAHPGYPDRHGFGRRPRAASSSEIERLIVDQFQTLAALAREAGATVRFVKPHGALYNQAQVEQEVALGVVAAVRALGMPVLGQPGGVLEGLAVGAGIRFVAEGFPDRRYTPDGWLVPRSRPDSVLHDPAKVDAQVVRLVGDGLATLCIHGDDPSAFRNAVNVRAVLSRHGITARFWDTGE